MNLIGILKMTQEQLLKQLPKLIRKAGYNTRDIIVTGDYIYAKGDLPVLLVAHLDTYFGTVPDEKSIVVKGDTLSSPGTALGADDRAGVYAILQLLEFKPYILFTTDEEIGSFGSKAASGDIEKPDVRFIIELDRKGKDDCVFYDCHNYSFINYIEKFGFKFNTGTRSDISELCPAWDIAGVNLSIGYYREHKLDEFLRISEMNGTIYRVRDIFRNLPDYSFSYYVKDYDFGLAGGELYGFESMLEAGTGCKAASPVL